MKKQFIFYHWLLTLIFGTIIYASYISFFDSPPPPQLIRISFFLMSFGTMLGGAIIFSIPVIFLYIFLYIFLSEKKWSVFLVKTILTAITVIGIILVAKWSDNVNGGFIVIGDEPIYAYSFAAVLSGLILKLKKQKITLQD